MIFFFFSYKVTGIILAQLSKKQPHNSPVQLLSLTIKDKSGNSVPGFMVPSLLPTCQEGANILLTRGSFPRADPCPAGHWLKGMQAQLEAPPSKVQEQQPLVLILEKPPEGWTQAWLNSYQVLPLEGDVSKQSLTTRKGTAPGVGSKREFPIHSISRAFENHEAPSEILTDTDILSFRQRNNWI